MITRQTYLKYKRTGIYIYISTRLVVAEENNVHDFLVHTPLIRSLAEFTAKIVTSFRREDPAEHNPKKLSQLATDTSWSVGLIYPHGCGVFNTNFRMEMHFSEKHMQSYVFAVV